MSRDSNGNYTLPGAYNPVVAGTVITDLWANTTLNDVTVALTDSLSRSGKGGMTVPFRVPDGTVAAPSLSFVNETTSGMYRATTGEVRVSIQGADVFSFSGSALLAGVPLFAPTPAPLTDSTQVPTTSWVNTLLAGALSFYAPINSPTFTGLPRVPTPTAGDSSTLIPNTQFVSDAIFNAGALANPVPGFILFNAGVI